MNIKSRALEILALGALVAFGADQAVANMVSAPGNIRFNVKVKSLAVMKFRDVVKQKHDLSCGAAALATLFKYYYREKTDEKRVVDTIIKYGDKDKIQKDGFSMLELKRYGERRGYVSQGFKIPKAENLEKLKVPVVTLINTRGYNHFVVIKGVKNGRVFIADPAFGNSSRPLESFAKDWKNVILVFLSATNGGNAEFQKDATLRARRGELTWLIDQQLFGIRPGTNEF